MANDFLKVQDADPTKYKLLSAEATTELTTHAISGVTIFDFGQGDCNAIVADTGKPLVFFDMGGGKHTGSRTHPWHTAWETEPCKDNVLDVSLKPTVVLSHWDGDHYSTAWYITNSARLTTKKVPDSDEVKDLQWLVPRQCKHPSKLEFVAQLTNVRCWPAGGAHRFNLNATTDLFVEACSGNPSGDYDPNLDGLAVRVDRVKAGGDGAVETDVVARIVLPGDAPYQFIPSCKNGPPGKVSGMLAFHHGSSTHLDDEARTAMPVAADANATIGYTFGLKPDGSRCYGHPSTEAITAYEQKQWTTTVWPSGGFDPWPPPDSVIGSTQQTNRAAQTLNLPAAPVPRPISLRRRR